MQSSLPTNIKSTCPNCGGEKKLNTKVVYVKGDAIIGKSTCYKCGYKVPADA